MKLHSQKSAIGLAVAPIEPYNLSAMIPPFNESGYLPPGVHPATLDEIDQRFGQISEIRRDQMESVRWMIELAIRAGVKRILLNGSFVTDTIEPGDVDCVLLAAEITIDFYDEEELDAGLPFVAISLVGPEDFDELANVTYASDRDRVPKGMIEVIKWN